MEEADRVGEKPRASYSTEQGEHVEETRRRDFFIIDNPVIDDYLVGLGPYAFTIYCYLARRAGDKKAAYPSVGRMARECKMDDKTVRNSLQKLTTLGLISITERTSPLGDQTTNLYRMLPVKRKAPDIVSPGVGDLTGGGGPPDGRHEEDSVKKTETPLPPEGAVAAEESKPRFLTDGERHRFDWETVEQFLGRTLNHRRDWEPFVEQRRICEQRGFPLGPKFIRELAEEKLEEFAAKKQRPRYVTPLIEAMRDAVDELTSEGDILL